MMMLQAQISLRELQKKKKEGGGTHEMQDIFRRYGHKV